MNHLEIRFYKRNTVIAAEMDECTEVLFVEQGYYKVGYRINNNDYYRRRFGMYTNIGGAYICYDIRFNFMFKSSTDLKGLAIRKCYLRQLLNDYQSFAIQLKHKFWKHYC